METLAEVIERDARSEMEPEPSGRLELEAESPLSTPQFAERAVEIASGCEPGGNTEVFFQVGERTTTVGGRTILLKDILPKIGRRWDGDARVWKGPKK
jgi:hypothetical protein